MKPLKSIDTPGLSQAVRDELLARLPVHPGDAMDPETVTKIGAAMRDYDEHLSLSVRANDDGTVVQIAAPEAQPSVPPERLRIGGSVQQTKLIRQPRPVYPREAKEAGIQGTVKLSAVIGKDGSIQFLEVLSGDPLLASSAVEAVKQWVYQPTLLNGNPVEVVTQIEVNYTLSQ
jgi:TonB family protein